MGYIADLHYDIAIQQMHEVNEKIQAILDKKDNDELFLLTNDSNDDLVIGIREYYHKYKKLSKKQRYCLARWILNNRSNFYCL